MKRIRQLHTYVAVAFAPLTVLFLFTGFVQTWDLHRGRKDGSYRPPRWVAMLSAMHTQEFRAVSEGRAVSPVRPFRIVTSILAAGMMCTLSLGVVMAYRFTRRKGRISALLLIGTLIPAVVLMAQRYGP